MAPSSLDPADKKAALALTPVSRETQDRLDRYVAVLLEWQRKTNLVAPSTIATLWTRHVADSLQLLEIAPKAKVWVDFGSGGGFPGVVLACALVDRPGATIHLVERNEKKAAFLREALRISGGSGEVHRADIKDYVDKQADRIDCVTARAVAPLNMLFQFAEPLVQQGAKALFLKGQDIDQELTEATKYWNIEAKFHPSKTDGGGRILELQSLERRTIAPPPHGPAR